MAATAQQTAPRYVTSGDVRIATYVAGNPDGPAVLLTHGWPDSHVLWDGVVPILAGKFRIIRYDNRGVGASSVPHEVSEYTVERLADDLAAVIGALSPGEPVHVLGHDWGSVATWEYLSRPGAADHVASFTSVSGPSVDFYGAGIIGGLKRPREPVRFARSLERWLRLFYWYPFAVPVVAPAFFRALFRGDRTKTALTDRVPPAQRFRADTIREDVVNSLKIYRAIVYRSPRRIRTDYQVTVPVQVIVSSDDPVIRPHGFDYLSRRVPQLWRRDINARHWSPMSHPEVLAQSVTELVEFLRGAPAAPELLRARVGR